MIGMHTPLFIFGATGFVGRNLLAGLASRGYRVTCLVRDAAGAELVGRYGASAVIGDVLEPETYRTAIPPGSQVLYLIHALGPQVPRGKFSDLDRRAAALMLPACRQAGVRRIIHLGGLGDATEKLSRHLASRAEVSRMISDSGLPAAILRASIIFGTDSASYEILRAALKLPIVPLPPWRNTRVQPIAIQDVIRCLFGTLAHPDLTGLFDIGGPAVYTYGELLRTLAAALGLSRKFFNIPVEARAFAALLLSQLSGVGVGETHALLQSLENTSIVPGENAISTVFGFEPTPVLARVR